VLRDHFASQHPYQGDENVQIYPNLIWFLNSLALQYSLTILKLATIIAVEHLVPIAVLNIMPYTVVFPRDEYANCSLYLHVEHYHKHVIVLLMIGFPVRICHVEVSAAPSSIFQNGSSHVGGFCKQNAGPLK
jgi:hypothetical protein